MTIQTIPAPLNGKVDIITGRSCGIGLGTALLFASQGCSHMAITYLSSTAVAEFVLSSISTIDPSIVTAAFPADICNPGFGKHVIDSALQELQVDHIDILRKLRV
jgi:3-oxoacyl-[acyl-carrier protein] reductase